MDSRRCHYQIELEREPSLKAKSRPKPVPGKLPAHLIGSDITAAVINFSLNLKA